MQQPFNSLKAISKEQFDDKLKQAVRLGIATWERRRLIIECDEEYHPAKYQGMPKESGLICNLCQARQTEDPLKLSHIFKRIYDAMESRETVLKAIDDGLAETRAKAKDLWGVEL